LIARTYTQVREKLKYYCDLVTNDSEIIIVTRIRGDNVVLMSENHYNAMVRSGKKEKEGDIKNVSSQSR
jgi:antitoxin YefM